MVDIRSYSLCMLSKLAKASRRSGKITQEVVIVGKKNHVVVVY